MNPNKITEQVAAHQIDHGDTTADRHNGLNNRVFLSFSSAPVPHNITFALVIHLLDRSAYSYDITSKSCHIFPHNPAAFLIPTTDREDPLR